MLSDRCGEYAPRAFCHYLLPTCVNKNHIRLCRADCEMLKHSFCDAEFQNFSSIASGQATSGIDMIMSGIASRFDCRKLPTVDDQCTAIGLPPVLNTSHTCYEGTGLGMLIAFFNFFFITKTSLRISRGSWWKCNRKGMRKMGRCAGWNKCRRVSKVCSEKFCWIVGWSSVLSQSDKSKKISWSADGHAMVLCSPTQWWY